MKRTFTAATLLACITAGSVHAATLTEGDFFVIGSQNNPTANGNFKISAFDGNAGFSGQGNDIPTGNTSSISVNETISDPVVDYRFFREGTNDTTLAYATGTGGLISNIVITPSAIQTNTSNASVWTTTDPGVNYAEAADHTSNTTLVGFNGALTGSIDISSLSEGTVYFFYGAYRNTPSFNASMNDTDGPEAAIDLLGFGDNDFANNYESYAVSIDFTNDAGYDTIDYSLNSNNGRFTGIIVTGVPEPGSLALLGLGGLLIGARRRRD